MKILFATNDMPMVNGSDTAFKRRLRIIKFLAQFVDQAEVDPDKNQYLIDRDLEEKLSTPESLSAILAWAVRGAIKYYRDGMECPSCVLAEVNEYMDDQDDIGNFITQCLEITDATMDHAHPGNRTSGAEVYQQFKTYCTEVLKIPEDKVISNTRFGLKFKDKQGITRTPPKNVRYYNVLIRSRETWEQDRDDQAVMPF